MTRGGTVRRKVSPREIYGGKVNASLLFLSLSLSCFLHYADDRLAVLVVLRRMYLQPRGTRDSSQVIVLVDPSAESST